MVSNGDEIDVHDYGICKIDDGGEVTVYLVEETDGSINWYINPNVRDDRILLERKATFVKER